MKGTDWTDITMAITFGFGFFVLGTVILVVIIRQLAENSRHKAALARDRAYQTIAESYDSLARNQAENQERIAGEIAGLSARLAAVERLLREIE
ncbi:MAG: hypothetical protein ACRDPT_06905 [Streptomycetales bacterium]